jgi:hypothetical protein
MRNQRIKTTPEHFDQTSDEIRRTELFVEENAKIVNDAIGMEWHQKIGTIQPPLSHGAVGVTQLATRLGEGKEHLYATVQRIASHRGVIEAAQPPVNIARLDDQNLTWKGGGKALHASR